MTFVLAVTLPVLCFAQGGPKLYRWVDKNGDVHYSDRIPPEQSATDRDILNTQGVHVASEQGEVTAEERAEIERKAAEAAALETQKLDIARRDRMLLETYLSVADIADLRDRRLELLESQIKVTELYLANLRKKLESLQSETARFKPYSAKPDAPQIPENLAKEISRTTASINLYEQTLTRTRVDQQKLQHSFNADIERFRELKGG
jgi:uncharacterized protein DUF4124